MSKYKENPRSFDLTEAGAKCDLRKVIDHGFKFRHKQLKPKHFDVLGFIFYRTVGWSRIEEWASYRLMLNGIRRKEPDEMYGEWLIAPVKMSRATLIETVKELLEIGILKRREYRQGEDETDVRYIYSIDYGAGIVLQGYGHSLGEQAKTISLYLCNTDKIMLPTPKRLKSTLIIDHSRKLTPEEEFGEEEGSPEIRPPSPSFLDPLGTDFITHIDTEEKTQERKTWAAEAAEIAEPVHSRIDLKTRLQETLETSMASIRARKEVKARAISEKPAAKIGDIETIFKTRYSQVFGKSPVPWTMKEKGQISELQKKWLAMDRKGFASLLAFIVEQWESIGTVWFNYEGESEMFASKRYPERPAVSFIVKAFSTYIRAYDKQELIADEPAMTPRQKFVARLEARGFSEERIAYLVSLKFPDKSPVERNKKNSFDIERKNFMEQERENSKKRFNLQPVAKPSPLVETTEFKFEALPQWK